MNRPLTQSDMDALDTPVALPPPAQPSWLADLGFLVAVGWVLFGLPMIFGGM